MESIAESNELIAKFMGLAYCTRHNYEGWYRNSEFNHRICDYNGLKYHSDWNEIMPVVVECFNRYDAVEDSLSNHQFMLNDALLETNIKSLYRAVVEFIKWYNAAANIKDKE